MLLNVTGYFMISITTDNIPKIPHHRLHYKVTLCSIFGSVDK